MSTLNKKLIKILLILWPMPSDSNLIVKKLSEITIKMDDGWKIFALKGSLPKHFTNFRLPCPNEFHLVSMYGYHKSIISRMSYFINCILKGVKLVKEENIDVITQHDGHLTYGMVAYIVSRLTHRKCLIRVNEDTLIPLVFFLRASNNYVFKSKTILSIVAFTYRRMEVAFFKHVDWVVTHGPMDYQKIKRLTNRITFVPLWVDVKKFKRFDEEAVQKFREKFVSTKNVKILLFVGRLHPEKGLPTLLKALKLVKNMKILLLMIYSISEYRKDYEKLAEHLKISDKIRFIGYVHNDELPKYYNIADLYVLPSIREEWSNTLMEAMACKTPVIATEVGGNPYLVIEGKTGFLVPPKDPVSLAQKIKFVLENPYLAMRVAEVAAKKIEIYDKDKIGESYKTVVKNLIRI